MTIPTDADTPGTPPERLRLFTALPVPAACTRRLDSLPRKGIDARWSTAGDLHITLRFLGDVPAAQQPDIEAALARVRRPAFHVELDGIDAFRDHRPPVLYARIASIRKMNALCADITDALTPLGFDFGQRPFVPHITLARLNHPGGLDAYLERHGQIRESWPADAFGLMRSAPPDGAGRRYALLRSYRLAPA